MKPLSRLKIAALLLTLASAGSTLLVAEAAQDTASKTPAPAAPAAETGKVDLNSADAATLEKLPGVGTDFANAVIAARPFKSVDDLARVQGIGPDKIKILRDKVRVSPVVAPETKTDTNATSKSSKPPAANEGRAVSGKEVTERHEQKKESSEQKK